MSAGLGPGARPGAGAQLEAAVAGRSAPAKRLGAGAQLEASARPGAGARLGAGTGLGADVQAGAGAERRSAPARRFGAGRRLGALAAGLALALTAAACGSGDGDRNDGAGDATDGAAGGDCTEPSGTLTMGTYAPPPGLDPKVMGGGVIAGGVETAAIFDRLMRYDPETAEFEPHVAESLEPNDDYTRWTLVLRDGIEFGNGDPLTAEAVRYSIERLQAEDNPTQSRSSVLPIEDMEVVDDRTLELTLSHPWPGFPAVLADEGGMVVNPAVVEAQSPEDFALDPNGAGVGPYEVERFAPDDEVVLVAKDDYWGGTPCIERLRFVAVPDAEDAYDAFRTGELDLALVRNPRVIAEAEAGGVESFVNHQNSGEVIVANQFDDSLPTADVRVRRAAAYAIDQEAIDERINEGTGTPSSGIVGVDAGPFTATEGLPHDPDRARQLVDEARADGWDGRVSLVCDAARGDQTLAVAAQLDAVGFEVETDITLTINDLIERVRANHNYELACWGFNYDASTTWVRLFTAVGPEGPTGYRSAEMDAALADLQAAATPEEQQAAVEAVQDVWNEDVPAVPLAATPEVILVQDRVGGLVFTSKTVVLFHEAFLTE
ncbi:MAG TPA: ABC transporter substrate-binding protein [Acidimicrobiales bacterium]